MEYNYVEVNKSFFPTKCVDYPADAKIETRMFTVSDVKLIGMMDANNVQDIVKELLRRCCRLTNLTIDDLYLADRDYLLFWLRSGSFISQNGYTFKVEACQHCNQPITVNMSLNDLELDFATITHQTKTIHDVDIEFRLPRVKDKQYKLQDVELSKILNHTNLVEIYGDVKSALTEILSWDAYSYVMLNNIVDSMHCGIKEEFYTTCPKCKQPILITWHFNDTDVLNKIDLKILLTNIVNIAKYSHYQITDDMLYAEVELIAQIVSEMIDADNKSMEQSQGYETFTNRRF